MSPKVKRDGTKLLTESTTSSDLESYTPLLDPSRSRLAKRWDESRINTIRLAAAFWGFTINGAQDASLGVSLSPLRYNL